MKKRIMLIGLDAADPVMIEKLINKGKLPNIKKALEIGVANKELKMVGVLPSVTPPNWATLATGCYPLTHGVTCFFNHKLGMDLGTFGVNWDANRINAETIWESFDKEGRRCIMLNYCEAWPPREEGKSKGIFIDGSGVVPFLRCQADFQKVVYLEEGDFQMREIPHYIDTSAGDCVVYGETFEEMQKDAINATKNKGGGGVMSMPTTDFQADIIDKAPSYEDIVRTGSFGEGNIADQIFTPLKDTENWTIELPSNAKAATVILNDGLSRRFMVVTASDGVNYDTVTLYSSRNNAEPLGSAKKSGWSDIIRDVYYKNDKKVNVAYKMKVMDMESDGSKAKVYISYAVNTSDLSYFYPEEVGSKIYNEIGPMISFGKFDDEDIVQAEEMLHDTWDELYKWHEKAADWLFNEYPDWELFYTHVHGIDEYKHWYLNRVIGHPQKERYVDLIERMYEINDRYVGSLMKQLDSNTSIFICSDHGAVPHSFGDNNPGIGHLAGITSTVMEELGLTKTRINEEGKTEVVWEETVAVAQRSSYVYINLKGRDPKGIVEPEDYNKTVQMVIDKLYGYRHPATGERVISFCLTRDEMEIVGMGGDHCGDILFQVVPTFCDEHAFSPSTTKNEGYSLNNLCIMVGAGFKQGQLINRPIKAVDIVPTMCHLAEAACPSNCEGGVIWQALEGYEEKVYNC